MGLYISIFDGDDELDGVEVGRRDESPARSAWTARAYRAAIFDHFADSSLPVRTSVADQNSVLVFDGIFLHRAELRNELATLGAQSS